MPWIVAEVYGMVNPSGFTMRLPREISLPCASCNCHANCTNRGQFSLSVNGAFQSRGKPVVSVS